MPSCAISETSTGGPSPAPRNCAVGKVCTTWVKASMAVLLRGKNRSIGVRSRLALGAFARLRAALALDRSGHGAELRSPGEYRVGEAVAHEPEKNELAAL